MADSDKDILITPNTSVATTHPEIKFVGKDDSPMYLRVLDDNTLSFEGTEGQVFSMSPTLSSGDIFSVNDISGIQSMVVNADGTITLNPTNSKRVEITGSVMIPESERIYFKSTDTYIGSDADSSEDLHIGADGHIELEADGDVIIEVGNTEYARFDGSALALGIGTSSPGYELDVGGTVNATNFRIGGAQGSDGQVLTSTGSGVAWESVSGGGGGGASTLNDLTDVLISGDSFIINNMGSAPTTGTLSGALNNIAIGDGAMDALTQGDGNIAFGDSALGALTTGTYNIAIGEGAMVVSTGGMSDNVAIGRNAAAYIDGDQNVAIGLSALSGANSGTVSAHHNVAIGENTLALITSGHDNIAIGDDAGIAVTTGDYNIMIGHDAGDSVVGGDDNILIGRNSGQNITSGSDNVIIGGVDAPSATGNDQLMIASGDGGVTWLAGASNGRVGIGTTSPGTSLHVSDAENVTLSVDSSNSIGSQISLDATATGGDEWRLVSAADGASADAGAFGLYNIDTSAYRFVVKADGNVGIGTTSPSFASGIGLEITHGTQANLRVTDSSASASSDFAQSENDTYIVNRKSGGEMKFRTDGSKEALTLKGGNAALIGTSVVALSSGTTLTRATHAGRYLNVTSSGITVTLPQATVEGEQYCIVNNNGGTTTVGRASSVTINGASSNKTITTQYQVKVYFALGTGTSTNYIELGS